MSRLGVWLAEAINRIVPPQAMHQDLDRDKLSIDNYQTREYEEVQKIASEFGGHWNLQDKHLLDVGSGLGGKPLYYAGLGARTVTAIDIRMASMQAASRLKHERDLPQIQLLVADAAKMPFPADAFDTIVSINVLEHVDDLPGTLAECRRALRLGGLMFLHFPPFYSPWGAHLEGWVNFPWPHVFFSDATLLEVAKRVELRRRRNADYIPSAQVDWEKAQCLPGLNRATVTYVKQLIRALDLTVVEYHLLPFGRHYLARRGLFARGTLRFLNLLTRLPGLQEVITTKMVFVLTKVCG
jgi:ubiquinone/menaquinone biosynthesis C-methylase UbiE